MDQSLWQTLGAFNLVHSSCCDVGNRAQHCRLGLFQDSDFTGDFEDSKSTSGGVLCIFGNHTFVPVSWMCKKQTSVSYSSCRQEHLTRHFSPAQCAHLMMCYTTLAQERVCAHHPIPMVIHDARLIERLFSLCSSLCSFPCVSPILCSALPTSTCSQTWTPPSTWTTPRQSFPAPPPTEEFCSLAVYTPWKTKQIRILLERLGEANSRWF